MEHQPQSPQPTPGPWELGNLINEVAGLHLAVWPGGMEPGAIGNPVCIVSPVEKLTMQDWANARLIAAAPELLEVARLAAELGMTFGDQDTQQSRDLFSLWQMADNAISKATPHL